MSEGLNIAHRVARELRNINEYAFGYYQLNLGDSKPLEFQVIPEVVAARIESLAEHLEAMGDRMDDEQV